jgi:hypothetical protein
MAVSYNDKYLLSQDATFQNRVRTALIAACISIKNESLLTNFHRERETYLVAVMNSPDSFKAIVAAGVATDASVISDATAAGTVALTSGNVAAQAALVTDAHIDTAIAGQFNAFFRTPS